MAPLARGLPAPARGLPAPLPADAVPPRGPSAPGRPRRVLRRGGPRPDCAGQEVQTVVILGAGVVGVATAYYLTRLAERARRCVRPVVVDRCGVGRAASGMAAGFLPRSGWARGPQARLHEQSFDLLRDLAGELQFESYSPLPTWLGVPGDRWESPPEGFPRWLDGRVASAERMPDEVAQIDCRELVDKLARAAQERGTEFRIGRAEGVRSEGDRGHRQVRGVVVDGEVIPCDAVVVALGPWSVLAEDWFDDLSLRMRGTLGTTATFRRAEDTASTDQVFWAPDEHGRNLTTLTRRNGDVYCLGFHGRSKVLAKDELRELSPEAVAADRGDLAALTGALREVSGAGRGQEPHTVQAGVRSVMEDHVPMIGKIPGYGNTAMLACGHNCFGILCGPSSGLGLAELLLHGEATSIDLAAFNPLRMQIMR